MDYLKNGLMDYLKNGLSQKWTIQGHGQHWTNKTQDEDKQSKYTNTKLNNMNPTDKKNPEDQ